jgi:hypothetical protein
MDTSTQILLFVAAVGLIALVKGKDLIKEYRAFAAWRRGEFASALAISTPPAVSETPAATPTITVDTRTLKGAGTALLNPPADLRASLSYIKSVNARRFAFPLGWRMAHDGMAECVSASFVGDVNHVLLTGFTDSGKDSWAATALISLAQTMTPTELQIAIIDGKGGLSWIGWGEKQHVWLMAKRPDDIKPAMDQLKDERERRTIVLEQAGCEKWEEYEGADMPLLVVFVSELMLLQAATSKNDLADWLNVELTSARAAGIRYIVSTQTATRLDTRWRSQVGLYVAGYQPREDADEPNTTFSTKDLVRFGTTSEGTAIGIPPSALPVPPAGAGVFTCVQGRTVMTVRASYLNKEHRTWLLNRMPNRENPLPMLAAAAIRNRPSTDDNPLLAALVAGLPLPIEEEHASASVARAIGHQKATEALFEEHASARSTSDNARSKTDSAVNFVELPLTEDVVPFDEQRRIIEAAPTAKNRRQLTMALYQTDGGVKATWVKKVCDALGLFPVQGVVQ